MSKKKLRRDMSNLYTESEINIVLDNCREVLTNGNNDEKIAKYDVLLNICANNENIQYLYNKDILSLLVNNILLEQADDVRLSLIILIRKISSHKEQRRKLFDLNVVQNILNFVVTSESQDSIAEAIATIWNISAFDDNLKLDIYNLDKMEIIVGLLDKYINYETNIINNLTIVTNVCGALRSLALLPEVSIKIFKLDIYTKLLPLLNTVDLDKKCLEQVISILWNISAKYEASKMELINKGILTILSRLIEIEHIECKRLTLGTIRALSRNAISAKCVYETDLYEKLQLYLNHYDIGVKNQALYAFTMILYYIPPDLQIIAVNKNLLLIILKNVVTNFDDIELQNMCGLTLRNLTDTLDIAIMAYSDEFVLNLINVLKNGTTICKEYISAIIWNIARDKTLSIKLIDTDILQLLMNILKGTDYLSTIEALGCMRAFAATSTNVYKLCDIGLTDLLPILLSDSHPEIQEQAAATCWNIGHVESYKRTLGDAGVLPLLVQLLESTSPNCKYYSAGALRSLALLPYNSEIIFNSGIVDTLILLLTDITITIKCKEQLIALLWNVSAKHEASRIIFYNAGILPILNNLLELDNMECKRLAVGSIRAIVIESVVAKAVIESDLFLKILNYLKGDIENIIEQSTAVIWNMCTTENVRSAVYGFDIIPIILKLLNHKSFAIKRLAAGVFRALSVTTEYKAILFEKGIIPPIIELLKNGPHDCKEQAAAVIWNVGIEQSTRVGICKAGAVLPLIEVLNDKTAPNINVSYAAGSLRALALEPENALEIYDSNGVLPIIKILSERRRDERTLEECICVLWHVAIHDATKMGIKSLGAVDLLEDLSNDVNVTIANGATETLRNISSYALGDICFYD